MAIRPEDQFLQGQISALRLICQFLIEELAATEEARQRIMDAMKKAGNEFRVTQGLQMGQGAGEMLLKYLSERERRAVREFFAD